MFAHLEFVDRRAGQQFAVNRHTFYHFLSNFFRDDPLHRFGHEFQITLIRDLKFDFIPDVREQRPGIIPNDLVEYLFIWKSNNAATGMIAGNVLAAELPQSRVEISHIDDITGSVSDLDAVADAKRLSD